MSLEASVASVLRQDPVGRIGFKVEMISVDKSQMESVAKAIEKRDVVVETGSTGPQLGAAYSSWKTRRLDPGEKKLIGKITLGSANVVKTSLGRAAIFHESVHALIDVKDLKVSMHNDEVAAYLADAMYLKATKTSISGGALERAIYDAAFRIIDVHKMLAKPGVILIAHRSAHSRLRLAVTRDWAWRAWRKSSPNLLTLESLLASVGTCLFEAAALSGYRATAGRSSWRSSWRFLSRLPGPPPADD